MKNIRMLILVFACFFISIGSVKANDQEDVDTFIRETINKALNIARDTKKDNVTKREELWEMVHKIFDLDKITEFTLGKFSADSKANLGKYADRRFTIKQQEEFRELFIQNLGNTYLDRLEFKNVDVKIDLQPAEMLKPKKGMKRARVNSVVNDKTPVDYMMLKRENLWRAYDVRVEGRSLVAAFRKEYNTILAKKTPQELLTMLRKKISEHETGNGAK